MKKVILIISVAIGAIVAIGGFLMVMGFVVLYAISPNSLGAYDERQFPTQQSVIENAIDSFYIKHPEHIVPEKWLKYDNWYPTWPGGHSYIFYFDSEPEELLYVNFIKRSDSNTCLLGVRSVNSGQEEWEHAHNTFPSFIQSRVSKRFNDEIISKIENIVGIKSTERKD